MIEFPQKRFGVSEALESLARGKNWMLENDDFATLQWFEETCEPPTLAEVEAEIIRLHEEYDTKILREEEQATKSKIARDSAIKKLSALGLTEEEAKALIGIE